MKIREALWWAVLLMAWPVGVFTIVVAALHVAQAVAMAAIRLLVGA